MFLKDFVLKLSRLLLSFRQLWFPPAPSHEQLILQEMSTAREELLCLLSWYNEISSQDPHFVELVYRLLASELRYRICLDKLRPEGIGRKTVPYTPVGPRRGITLNGYWYGW